MRWVAETAAFVVNWNPYLLVVDSLASFHTHCAEVLRQVHSFLLNIYPEFWQPTVKGNNSFLRILCTEQASSIQTVQAWRQLFTLLEKARLMQHWPCLIWPSLRTREAESSLRAQICIPRSWVTEIKAANSKKQCLVSSCFAAQEKKNTSKQCKEH